MCKLFLPTDNMVCCKKNWQQNIKTQHNKVVKEVNNKLTYSRSQRMQPDKHHPEAKVKTKMEKSVATVVSTTKHEQSKWKFSLNHIFRKQRLETEKI